MTFELAERLFGVTIERADGSEEVCVQMLDSLRSLTPLPRNILPRSILTLTHVQRKRGWCMDGCVWANPRS